MPDATRLLEHDHREVERLMARYEQSRDPHVLRAICEELTIHMEVEEHEFYPQVTEKVDGARRLVDEGRREHDEVKQVIARLRDQDFLGDVASLFSNVKERIEHHVREEEHELFPKVRQQIPDALGRMADRIEQAKRRMQQSGTGDGLEQRTKDELYQMAKEQEIPGRSDMTKDQLVSALREQSS